MPSPPQTENAILLSRNLKYHSYFPKGRLCTEYGIMRQIFLIQKKMINILKNEELCNTQVNLEIVNWSLGYKGRGV